MFKLILKGTTAYKWTQSKDNCFLGYIYTSSEKIYRNSEAINLLNELLEQNQNNLLEINNYEGLYSFIKLLHDKIIIVTDIVNFFPIFYLRHNNQWIISDDWQSLIDYKSTFDFNEEASIGFLSGGFVCGNKTLDKTIKKTESGVSLTLNFDGTTSKQSHFDFIPQHFTELNKTDLKNVAEQLFLDAGKEMIGFLNHRTAIVPLSGGFDSRLIVCLLKKLNYENVICFTYGRKTKEVEISKDVAAALGYKWYFINYEEIDSENYLLDPSFIDYVHKYSNGYSMFFLQEYFAMRELLKMEVIPKDSVFLPGHSGDFIGGSYVEKTAATRISPKNLAPYLLKKYFFFKKPSRKNKDILIADIVETLKDYPVKNTISKIYNPYVEDWDIKEKLSKFIFRSSYVFTHFGFEHIFPLWTRKTIQFFRAVPYEMRSEKKLYNEILIEKFFISLNVFFGEEELKQVSKIYMKYQRLKDSLRNAFPWSFVLKKMINYDWLNYYVFTKAMEKDLIRKNYKPLKRFKMFTAIICRWYLDLIISENKKFN
ncbi:MAG TPA: asparagine synthase C-terminal domain-containing protein [Bacteroidales bacterium]|nr:asparagine synthase C-terminal domain-containing protein [Bacteroidales bacterium]